jgi:hypothetical protein
VGAVEVGRRDAFVRYFEGKEEPAMLIHINKM